MLRAALTHLRFVNPTTSSRSQIAGMASMAINGTSPPKITLYTNHNCPFAQRAHITLDELKLPYDEVLIDLDAPRPQWYLDINPRGLVPTIKFGEEETTITESAIVAQFLCDTFPSHLLPSSSEALTRARIAFFCQTWTEKISLAQFGVMRAQSAEDKEVKAKEAIAVMEKEIEPLLKDAAPFFGGSEGLTFAEVFTAPFVMRWITLVDNGEMVPSSMMRDMENLPNFWRWSQAILAHGNATRLFDKEIFLEHSRKRLVKNYGAKV